jgi:VWFA-related protein
MKTIGLLLCALQVAWPQESPRFSSNVQLVMVDVQVTEKGTGRVLDLLGPKDFELYDNGNQQNIREFHFETTPLDLVFLKYGHLGWGTPKEINEFMRGLTEAVDELRSGDRAAVFRTDSESEIDLPISEDREKVRHALVFGDRRYRAGYKGHLYDATRVATTLFAKPKDPARRRAIIVITDDIERGSKIKVDPLIEVLLEADATLNEIITAFPGGSRQIRTAGLPPWKGPLGIPDVTHRIGSQPMGASLRPAVQATGGEAVPGDLFRGRFPELIRRIRLRYLLGFYAEPATAREFHNIEVQLAPQAKTQYPSALIRARRGYYSEPVSSTAGR